MVKLEKEKHDMMQFEENARSKEGLVRWQANFSLCGIVGVAKISIFGARDRS